MRGAQNGEMAGRRSREAWGNIWFSNLAKYHRVDQPQSWRFDEKHVIAFLRSKLKAGVPTWKRLKIVEGLICYRNRELRTSEPRLEHLRAKLQEILVKEKHADDDLDIEELIGKIDPREPDVIQLMRRTMRGQRKQYNTEKAYVKWVRQFMVARCLKNLADFENIDERDVESFLTDLAVDGDVAISTQEQAYYGLKYLLEQVLKRELDEIDALRASKPKLVPTVMSRPEVSSILAALTGIYLLIAQLLYGCGMRISECLRLRVMDIDFDLMQIRIYNSKGNKSRLVPLPVSLVDPLKHSIRWRRGLHEQDLATGEASVWLPHALSRKYPEAHRQFKWQFLFASMRFSRDPRTGKRHRHHIHRDTFPARLKQAVEAAGVTKHVTSHTFRHSFATHLLSDGMDIRSIQELLGHNDVNTTMIYTHVLNQDDVKIVSPLDRLCGEQSISTVENVNDNELQSPVSRDDSSRPSRSAIGTERRRWGAIERLGRLWLAVKRSTIQDSFHPTP